MRGLTPVAKLIRAERSAMEFAFSETLALLASPERPTAFLCLGTRILAGVLQGLRHSGRMLPEEISALGIGGTDLSRLFSPAITSLTWDLDAVGTSAAELLLKQLDREVNSDPGRILITTQLVLRESCGRRRCHRRRSTAAATASLPGSAASNAKALSRRTSRSKAVIALGHNVTVLCAVADRLRQPEGRWQPFDFGGFRNLLYRRPSDAPHTNR